ncbi:hypothetical protein CS022_09890 [Veronia nyctiphanis]|uniref:Peptidase M28 domain-containing protein n=1 Tax=Veronia nyctiphanis TaxID=1278244 RepID=A0A4Q0YQC0_9GAMM|nr:M28 family peptidase [Veronia nyctiphanis]RXJ73300.1 hypothetical protein CS022_09890 [Veronia nyctiphanis]
MGYAAEEVGLLGSAEIAADYKRSNKDVKGVLQLDMTNYHGSMDDFYFVSDYTNATQTQYLKDLVKEYLPEYRANDTACGYACSDHASWHRNGFPASMPSESKFGEHNKAIHTAGDTLDKSGHAAAHAYKFAKLALTYAADMTNLESEPEPYIEFTVNGLEVSFNYNTSGPIVLRLSLGRSGMVMLRHWRHRRTLMLNRAPITFQ